MDSNRRIKGTDQNASGGNRTVEIGLIALMKKGGNVGLAWGNDD